MVFLRRTALCMTVAAGLLWSGPVSAQEMPREYKTVLTTLGKNGDFKEGVLKVNIPRSDLRVTISQRPAPTPFGFGGWIALTKGCTSVMWWWRPAGSRPRSTRRRVRLPGIPRVSAP
jgi:hypothetical protein